MSGRSQNAIAVFGGSFNPVHLGHIEAARKAMLELEVDKLLLIPVSAPPHKRLPEGSPDTWERANLLSLAAEGETGVEVSGIELEREGPSYTADTVLELLRDFPESRIFLLMGTDMFMSLEHWRNFEYIAKNTTIAVFCRRSGESEEIHSRMRDIQKKYGADVRFVLHEPIDISSTEIRKLLSGRGAREYLPEKVYSRIIKLRHYGAQPDLGWLKARVETFLDPRRKEHVSGCECEAKALARRWGADEGKAAEAAILHDITKGLSHEEQLELCKKYAIIMDDAEKRAPKLLHAKTGAALARDEFGITGDVFEAIMWHTTGRAEMTLLEKILYLADYIEPNRSFDGLAELRRLSYSDIDRAMEMGLEMSMREITRKGSSIHPRSCEALRDFQNRKDEKSK